MPASVHFSAVSGSSAPLREPSSCSPAASCPSPVKGEGFLPHPAKPSTTTSACSTLVISSSDNTPMRRPNLSRGTAINFSAITADTTFKPFSGVGSINGLNGRSSIFRLVRPQVIIDRVFDNLSLCTISVGRGLLPYLAAPETDQISPRFMPRRVDRLDPNYNPARSPSALRNLLRRRP